MNGRSSGNTMENRENTNLKHDNICLLNEYGIVIGKGSDQSLSAPWQSWAFTFT